MNEKNEVCMIRQYQSIKKVEAYPMTYHEAGKKGLVRDYNKENKECHGYCVMYSDNYKSWSPKDVFDAGYIEIKQ